MQIYADVCNRPMKVSRSAQTCALGAAIFGAVVGGAYATVEEAQSRMTGVRDTVYEPIAANASTYAELYRIYKTLHDAFGTSAFKGSLSGVMKDLIRIRDVARRAAAN
jgi:L-ribulokinase